MSFTTDKQTLTDLNILGKYKVGSLFNLFNRVKTRGGELLLEEFFRSPLTNADAINSRAARIGYLRELDLRFSINPEMAEQASQYLSESRPATPLSSFLGCFRDKAQETLYRSPAYYTQQKQVHAVQEILYAASDLLGQLIKKGRRDNPLQEMQDELSVIVNAPALRQLKAKYPYSVQQTAQYQYLFRNKFRQELQRLLHVLYELDVYISVAEVAASKGLQAAVAFQDSKILITAEDLRHPSLSGAVGNDISLRKEENLLFLTGANMAGKSTWMKTLGVSFYLAHMGFPVAAGNMSFRVMEGIYTSINVPDDISQGWSHFYSEVMRVKLVAQDVSRGKKLFVLFDELFKGTNVKDAYDATLAVTQRLARYSSCAFVISTHIIEVGQELSDIDTIQFKYMPTVMDGAVPRYTYRLKEGITADRQGMIIIENEGILEMIG